MMKGLREEGLRVLAGLIRLVCGVRPLKPSAIADPKIYYANHTSHLDFTLIWAVLPHEERLNTRPVAGKDYWIRNKVTRFVGCKVFNAVLIERQHVTRENNPVELMKAAAEAGTSMIVFPEGTRGQQRIPGSFKSGLYHFSLARPDVPLIPVYLENLNRMMPKGTFFPLPLISRINIGAPLQIHATRENRADFLDAARAALIDLCPFPDE